MYCTCNKGHNYQVVGLCDVADLDVSGKKNWAQVIIPEVLYIPDCYPDIENIEKIYITVEITKSMVIETPSSIKDANGDSLIDGMNNEGAIATGRKLIVSGKLCQTIVYTADVCVQSLHSVNFEYPFCEYIVLPEDVDLDQKFCVEACVEDVYAKVLTPKTIFKSVTLFLLAEKLVPSCLPLSSSNN